MSLRLDQADSPISNLPRNLLYLVIKTVRGQMRLATSG